MSVTRPAIFALALGAAACVAVDGSDCDAAPDLPEDWTCARALEVVHTAPTCDQGIPDEMPTLALTSSNDDWQLTASGLVFRPEQAICAYARVGADGASLDVLLQPCDMHPAAPRKGSCGYEVAVRIAADDGITRVQGYRRWDLAGDPPVDDVLDLGEVDVR